MSNQTAPEDKEIQENAEKAIAPKSHDRRNLLKILEYVALGSSAIGSILAWWFEQILFAATPLTLTLGLNLLNRENLEKFLRQENNATTMQVENYFEVLHKEIEDLTAEPVAIEPAITDNLAQLQIDAKKLENTAITHEELDTIIERIVLLEEEISGIQESIKNESISIQKSAEKVEKKSELYATTAELNLDLKVVAMNIEKLQQQVAQLKKHNREIIKPYLQKLNRAVKELEKS